VDEAAAGEERAETDFKSGRVQVLAFGEMPPPGRNDRRTGLPLGSMGCEPSAEKQPFLDAYNERMLALVEAEPPFPEDLRITYSVRGPDGEDVVVVTRDRVMVNGEFFPAYLEGRMKVGILARQSRVKVPAGVVEGDVVYGLHVVEGERDWRMSWSETGRKPAAELLEVLEAWRSRRPA